MFLENAIHVHHVPEITIDKSDANSAAIELVAPHMQHGRFKSRRFMPKRMKQLFRPKPALATQSNEPQ